MGQSHYMLSIKLLYNDCKEKTKTQWNFLLRLEAVIVLHKVVILLTEENKLTNTYEDVATL